MLLKEKSNFLRNLTYVFKAIYLNVRYFVNVFYVCFMENDTNLYWIYSNIFLFMKK